MFKHAERIPPNICRFVARKLHGTQPMSHTDLAKKTGLSRSYIGVLSKKRTWKGVPIDVVDSFSKACGVNLLAPSETISYLRHSLKAHLDGADCHQRKFIASLLKKA